MIEFDRCETEKLIRTYFEGKKVESIKPVYIDDVSSFRTGYFMYYGEIDRNKQTSPIMFNKVKNEADFTAFNGYEIKVQSKLADKEVEIFFLDDPLSYDDFGLLNTSSLSVGGLGSTVTTKADFATFFNFTEGDITEFKIFGPDIYVNLSVTTYEVLNSAFKNNTDITFLKDNSGALKRLHNQCFYNSTNLSYVTANSLLDIGSSSLRNTGCERFDFPECNIFSGTGDFMSNNSKLKTINLPKLTVSPSNRSFNNNPIMSLLNAPLLASLGGSTGNDTSLGNIASGCVVNVASALQTIDGGSPDGDLVYAAGRGAVINYL